MNRWLRLHDSTGTAESSGTWRMHGIHEGIAWLTRRDAHGDGPLTVHAWDLASGSERLAVPVDLGVHARAELAGDTMIVWGGMAPGEVHAFRLDGPAWTVSGRCVGVTERLVATVLGADLRLLNPRDGRGEVHPDTALPMPIRTPPVAVRDTVVLHWEDGRSALISRGVRPAVPPPPEGTTRMWATRTDAVYGRYLATGRRVRMGLQWRDRFLEIDGDVTDIAGNRRHLLVASDHPLFGLHIEVFDAKGSVASVHPERAVRHAVADDRAVFAAWTGGAVWFTDRLTAVRLPPDPDLSGSIALWDGFPVACSDDGILAPLAPGSVSAPEPGLPPLVFAPFDASGAA
ncbi:MAG: hypothetical protein R3F61_32170 [Myxococcota bacterium]